MVRDAPDCIPFAADSENVALFTRHKRFYKDLILAGDLEQCPQGPWHPQQWPPSPISTNRKQVSS